MPNLCCLDDPTDTSVVKSLQDSAEGLSAKPVHRKDPVDNAILQNLYSLHEDTNDVLILRNSVMISFGFAGFLRFDSLR